MKRIFVLAALACALAPAAANATAPKALCAYMAKTTNDPGYAFKGWRCEAGPAKGGQTVLVYVKVTQLASNETKLLLAWIRVRHPLADSVVINSGAVPHYGYRPADVQAASGAQVA